MQTVIPFMDVVGLWEHPTGLCAAILVCAAYATACVAWFSAVDGWFEPWIWRFAGRVLGVRIESVCSNVGMLRVRTWGTVPLDHSKDFTVVMIGALTAILTAVVPAVAMFVLAARCRSTGCAAILTLMAMVTFPIGVAVRVLGDRKVDERSGSGA